MDNVRHLDKLERVDADVSFSMTLPKAREREPSTREDFREVKIALVNNDWTWAPTEDEGPSADVTATGKKFYEALCKATASSGRNVNAYPAASMEEWKAACVANGLIDPGGKADSARALMSKHRRELIVANWIASNEEQAWTLTTNKWAGIG